MSSSYSGSGCGILIQIIIKTRKLHGGGQVYYLNEQEMSIREIVPTADCI